MRALESKGSVVAALLRGAWRSSPPKLEGLAADLEGIVPILVESGTGALAWWRVRHSAGHPLPSVLRRLRATYLHYAVQYFEHEREIANMFHAMRSSDVEPILLKGWAIARSYPDSALRPAGDIDLYVSPDQYGKAKAVLGRCSCSYPVDLDHDTITRFCELTSEELHLRSQLVKLQDTWIRVLSAEDHLRILCLHLLKHGAWRPLWLCDVAVAVETRPPGFDWDRCLGKNRRHADWILCTLALANWLLGAEVKDTPAVGRVKALPRWLVECVLKNWGSHGPPNLPLFVDQVGPRWWRFDTIRAIAQRWPNPIQATVDAGGSFKSMTRLPFQIRDSVLRTARLSRQILESMRDSKPRP
jgi:hypothetical protein